MTEKPGPLHAGTMKYFADLVDEFRDIAKRKLLRAEDEGCVYTVLYDAWILQQRNDVEAQRLKPAVDITMNLIIPNIVSGDLELFNTERVPFD